MAGNNTTNSQNIIRLNTYNAELQENFNDDNFMANAMVRYLGDDVIDGTDTELKIPGTDLTAQFQDYVEGTDINPSEFTDTMFVFKPDQDKVNAFQITDKLARNSYYMNMVVPRFADEQTRGCYLAIDKYTFTRSQELPFKVDGVQHRLTGSGAGGKLDILDFSKAKNVLLKSSFLTSGYVAFISPDMATEIERTIGIVQQANSVFEPVAEKGLLDITGTRFSWNLYGVDVYVTNNLSKGVDSTSQGGTDNSDKTAVVVTSLQDPNKVPFIGAWIEKPTFELDRKAMSKVTNYICSYAMGVKLIYPKNLVVIECAE